MIWPAWMALTSVLAVLAHIADKPNIRAGLIAVLIGLIVSRIGTMTQFPGISMMLIWLAVSLYLFARGLYGMTVFSALSAACYFPLWASYFMADVFGVLMLISAGGGIYGLGANNRIGDWVFSTGRLHSDSVGRATSLDET